jgi:hypothetical protein
MVVQDSYLPVNIHLYESGHGQMRGLGKTVQPNFEITSEKPILRHSNHTHLSDAREIREIVISSISVSAAQFSDLQSDKARDDTDRSNNGSYDVRIITFAV